jgi:hypothetical protein
MNGPMTEEGEKEGWRLEEGLAFAKASEETSPKEVKLSVQPNLDDDRTGISSRATPHLRKKTITFLEPAGDVSPAPVDNSPVDLEEARISSIRRMYSFDCGDHDDTQGESNEENGDTTSTPSAELSNHIIGVLEKEIAFIKLEINRLHFRKCLCLYLCDD